MLSADPKRLAAIPPPIAGRVAIVGPCSAGKTTLAASLARLGYDTRQCGQEHSNVPSMWQHITRPETLVFLDVTIEVAQARRPSAKYTPAQFTIQRERLAHARAHCDIYVDTTTLSIEAVAHRVGQALDRRAISAETVRGD